MTFALYATLRNHLEIKRHRFTKIDGSREFKGIIHRKMYICCECTHPQDTQDVDEFVSWSYFHEKFSNAMLWIDDSYFSQKQQFEVKNVVMMDLFVTNMQLFS